MQNNEFCKWSEAGRLCVTVLELLEKWVSELLNLEITHTVPEWNDFESLWTLVQYI